MKTIQAIAERVRKNAEHFAARYPKHFGKDSLECMCAIAAFALAYALQQEEYEAQVVLGYFDSPDAYNEHCWVRVGNTIIDITATQFGIPEPVLITDATDPRYALALVENATMDDLQEWPLIQQPHIKHSQQLAA